METEEVFFRRRRLPHQDVLGHPVFLTACLEGSIPAAGFARIAAHRKKLDKLSKPADVSTEAEWDRRRHKMLFAFVDHLLDFEPAVRHLVDPKQATIVRDAFYHFADERYSLMAYVVMPSHHHWLFLPCEKWALQSQKPAAKVTGKYRTPREIISHSIQSYSATMCNRCRGSE